MKGHLFVFSGPSGVGKGTILRKVLKRLDNITFSVSCTTRKPRAEDIEGKSYFFIDDESFLQMRSEGLFLEWAEVHGHCYGTRKDLVDKALEKGTDIVLEIDVQGALQVKEKNPDAVTIFVMPPSMEALKSRLIGRGSETEEEAALRILNAEKEMSYAEKYDHTIVNNTVDEAVEDLIKIIQKYREEF